MNSFHYSCFDIVPGKTLVITIYHRCVEPLFLFHICKSIGPTPYSIVFVFAVSALF